METRPLRVLHIIDTLGGGGSERLVWDIVRLSDPARVQHRVVTIFPDGFLVPFVYAEALSELGAYRSKRVVKENFSRKDAKSQSRKGNLTRLSAFAPLRLGVKNLHPAPKKSLINLLNFGFSIR